MRPKQARINQPNSAKLYVVTQSYAVVKEQTATGSHQRRTLIALDEDQDPLPVVEGYSDPIVANRSNNLTLRLME